VDLLRRGQVVPAKNSRQGTQCPLTGGQEGIIGPGDPGAAERGVTAGVDGLCGTVADTPPAWLSHVDQPRKIT
jgi:hypothetical protein